MNIREVNLEKLYPNVDIKYGTTNDGYSFAVTGCRKRQETYNTGEVRNKTYACIIFLIPIMEDGEEVLVWSDEQESDISIINRYFKDKQKDRDKTLFSVRKRAVFVDGTPYEFSKLAMRFVRASEKYALEANLERKYIEIKDNAKKERAENRRKSRISTINQVEKQRKQRIKEMEEDKLKAENIERENRATAFNERMRQLDEIIETARKQKEIETVRYNMREIEYEMNSHVGNTRRKEEFNNDNFTTTEGLKIICEKYINSDKIFYRIELPTKDGILLSNVRKGKVSNIKSNKISGRISYVGEVKYKLNKESGLFFVN